MSAEPIPERKRWHNPLLDGTEYDDGTNLREPDETHPAQLASSLCEDGLHRPALDIDVPAELIPSSTPGHFHLYFPTVALTWDAYLDLLNALAAAGILEEGYVESSKNREQTCLRLPDVRKVTP